MWLISLRDLEWRRRRFAIAVLATGLVLALALLLTGVPPASTMRSIGRFRPSARISGLWSRRRRAVHRPIGFPASRAEDVRRASGVREADPVAIVGATAATPEPENVNVIGAVPAA